MQTNLSQVDRIQDGRVAAFVALSISLLALLRFYVLSSMAGRLPMALVPYRLSTAHAVAIVGGVRVFEGLIVPIAAVVLARARPLLWALLPFVLLALYAALFSALKQNVEVYFGSIWDELQYSAMLYVICLILGLPIRWTVRKLKARRNSATASGETDYIRVWPPEPKQG